MKSSTGTKVFTGIPAGDRILVISGATEDKPVKVEYKLDTTWVLADTFTSDGARIVFFGGSEFRIVAGTVKFGIS